MTTPVEPTTVSAAPASRGRSLAVWVLVVLAALLLLLSAFAIWVNRVALNTDVFVDTSTELIEDEEIRSAVATRAVDELFTSVDIQAELEEQLPPDYQRLSGPASAALREASYRVVDRALQQPAFQRLWALSLEQTHRTLVDVLEGGGDRVSTEEGIVSLDLEAIVLAAADRIGLREQVANNLPEDVGRIEILRADELDTAQSAAQLLKVLAWVLPILALVAFALAAWLSRDRRRLVRRIGLALVVIGVVGLLAVGVVGNYIVDSLVADTENRAAAGNAWDILTELLRRSFWWMLPVGVLFVVASWLAGPGARAIDTRHFLAPALRARVWPYVALAVVGLLLLLTGPVSDFSRYLLVAVLVALGVVWIEVMRAQTMREFPGAAGSDLLEEMRTRLSTWWEDSRRPAGAAAAPVAAAAAVPPSPPPGSDVASGLAALSELHAKGELTDEEYAAAKAQVLAGG
jgi:hypothetical protein